MQYSVLRPSDKLYTKIAKKEEGIIAMRSGTCTVPT
jgi:hypothetical protein